MNNKLAFKFHDKNLAAKLDEAGVKNPADIRKASDAQLAQAGLSKDEIAKVRGKYPKKAK